MSYETYRMIEPKHVLFNNKTGEVISVESEIECLKFWAELHGLDVGIFEEENDEYYEQSSLRRELEDTPPGYWELRVYRGETVIFWHRIDRYIDYLTRDDEEELYGIFKKYYGREIHEGDYSIMRVDSYIRYTLEKAADVLTLERIREVEYKAMVAE